MAAPEEGSDTTCNLLIGLIIQFPQRARSRRYDLPRRQTGQHQPTFQTFSLHHLVGEGKERERDGEAERLRGLEVDRSPVRTIRSEDSADAVRLDIVTLDVQASNTTTRTFRRLRFMRWESYKPDRAGQGRTRGMRRITRLRNMQINAYAKAPGSRRTGKAVVDGGRSA